MQLNVGDVNSRKQSPVGNSSIRANDSSQFRVRFTALQQFSTDVWLSYCYRFVDEIKMNMIHTPCLKKNSQNCFRQNFVKFPQTLIIFGTKMANTIELCKVHSLSTSPNLCQRTTA